jgi:hypothetical protein
MVLSLFCCVPPHAQYQNCTFRVGLQNVGRKNFMTIFVQKQLKLSTAVYGNANFKSE